MPRPEATVYILLLLFGFLIGGALPTQAGINTQLARRLGHPLQAAFVSFAIGTVVLGGLCIAGRFAWPAVSELCQIPPWMLFGGLLGTVFVTSTILLAPRLGASTMISVIVAGQILSSLVLDHYGWMGFQPKPLDVWRIVGAVLLVAGVFAIQRGSVL